MDQSSLGTIIEGVLLLVGLFGAPVAAAIPGAVKVADGIMQIRRERREEKERKRARERQDESYQFGETDDDYSG